MSQVKEGKKDNASAKHGKKEKFKFKKKVPKCVRDAENIEKLKSNYTSINPGQVKTFADLPMSRETVDGLKEAGFTKLTEIQRESIGLALQGKDILGAAKTGSGKTLAFLVPVLEKLYSQQWSRSDGAGALVITPTRELAYQIFETLRRVGKNHDFSAGLVIGGKDLRFEWSRVAECNVLICTPGRLLQHLDENPAFNLDNLQVLLPVLLRPLFLFVFTFYFCFFSFSYFCVVLFLLYSLSLPLCQMLVLDEADRCLDMGFSTALDSIVSSLPATRQTLLFSATQVRGLLLLLLLLLRLFLLLLLSYPFYLSYPSYTLSPRPGA